MADKSAIKYAGPDDVRVLDADDLKKAGVEGFRKTEFAKGETIEVSADAAQVLIDQPELYGNFERVERDAPQAEVEAEAKTDTPDAAEADAASGEAATNSAPNPATRPTGRASTKG